MRKINKIEPLMPTLPSRKKVAAYARVSMETERLQHSLSAQVSYYSELIQSNPEWEYAGVYADDGITGTKSTRAEFQRLLRDCEDGKIDIILTKSISRFARNTVDLLETVRHLKELGIEVRFEKECINSLSGDGEVMLTLLASFAQEEIVSLSNNVKWATQKRFQQGLHNGRFQIYGYRWEGDQLVIHEEEAAIVRLIYDNFLNGLSAESTEKQLAEMGVKAYKGGHFGNGSIRQILSNITYTGNLLFQKEYTVDPVSKKSKINRGELPQYFVENTHEAIIPMEVYQAVQDEKARRRELGVFANWSIQTTCFTSKIKCPHCGCSYVHNKRTKNGNVQEYWNCGSKKKKKVGDGCPVGGTISQKSLLKACTEVLGLTEFNEDVFLDQVDHIDVPEKYTLVFYLKDGTTVTKEAPNTGHQDCWTAEYRAKVSKRRMGKNHNKKHLNPFTGYFRCPDCGANFRRQTHKYKDGTMRIYWHCPDAPRCGNQAKPNEDTMKNLLAELLGLPEFDEATFKETVSHIDLIGNYEATVYYKAGGTDIITWEPVPKKSYPHTEAYKELMRERMNEYWTDERKAEMSTRVKKLRSEKHWSSKRK